jgi:hypothetical protein
LQAFHREWFVELADPDRLTQSGVGCREDSGKTHLVSHES